MSFQKEIIGFYQALLEIQSPKGFRCISPRYQVSPGPAICTEPRRYMWTSRHERLHFDLHENSVSSILNHWFRFYRRLTFSYTPLNSEIHASGKGYLFSPWRRVTKIFPPLHDRYIHNDACLLQFWAQSYGWIPSAFKCPNPSNPTATGFRGRISGEQAHLGQLDSRNAICMAPSHSSTGFTKRSNRAIDTLGACDFENTPYEKLYTLP